MKRIFNYFVIGILLSVTGILIHLDEYDYAVYVFSFFLLVFFIISKGINSKIFAVYFLLYFFIPFLNISNYRGTIEIETLKLYVIGISLFLLTVKLFEKTTISEFKSSFKITKRTKYFLLGHLMIVYSFLIYIYIFKGNIFLNQALRTQIPAGIEYIIKSGIYIPLLAYYCSNVTFKVKNIILYYALPLLPSILIGSRGTFIMMLISILISIFLFKRDKSNLYKERDVFIYRNISKVLIVAGLIGVFVFYSGFFLRRDGSELVTASEVISNYLFVGNRWLIFAVLPLYLNLRETVGITNDIIEKGITNRYLDYPMFVAEIATLLPGEQLSPGIILTRELYGGEESVYGLTPGIFGGLYMDFGYGSVLITTIFAVIIILLYNKGKVNVFYRIFYSITIVQFLHLYHRGFLKFEYFVPYIIIGVYLFTLKRSKSIEKSV